MKKNYGDQIEKIEKYNKFISELTVLKTEIFDKFSETDATNKQNYYKIL